MKIMDQGVEQHWKSGKAPNKLFDWKEFDYPESCGDFSFICQVVILMGEWAGTELFFAVLCCSIWCGTWFLQIKMVSVSSRSFICFWGRSLQDISNTFIRYQYRYIWSLPLEVSLVSSRTHFLTQSQFSSYQCYLSSHSRRQDLWNGILLLHGTTCCTLLAVPQNHRNFYKIQCHSIIWETEDCTPITEYKMNNVCHHRA